MSKGADLIANMELQKYAVFWEFIVITLTYIFACYKGYHKDIEENDNF